jgi:hypothetical protein
MKITLLELTRLTFPRAKMKGQPIEEQIIEKKGEKEEEEEPTGGKKRHRKSSQA